MLSLCHFSIIMLYVFWVLYAFSVLITVFERKYYNNNVDVLFGFFFNINEEFHRLIYF